MQQVETQTESFAAPPQTGRWQLIALVVGVIGLVAGALIGLKSASELMHAYLIGYMFWLAVTLGCLSILMLQHVAGGAWGVMVRRLLEAGARVLPLMFALFLPILLDPLVWHGHLLYEWASPEAMSNRIIREKSGYLNTPFWTARFVLYFVLWGIWTYFISYRWSRLQDETAEIKYAAYMKTLSGPGIVLMALTATFASVDWIMSLAPEWYSTIFGLITLINWALTAWSFIIMTAIALARRPPLEHYLAKTHFHDYGKLLLAFVLLWAYLNLSQFLIIWSGNLPEEISWYVTRLNVGWQYVGLAVVLFHFALPFLLLLSRDLKRNLRLLMPTALLLFVMRFVDLYWAIGPQAHTESQLVSFSALGLLLSVAMAVGIGGVWCFFYFWQLRRMPLLPLGDPGLDHAIAQGRAHGH